MDADHTRLNELEIKLAYAEDLLETLNLTVFRQQEQIELLQRQLRELHQQVQAAGPGEGRNLRDEIPPHY
ncbi:SlyX protein [Oryzomicrobium terrae]|jgi:SlyX protein|uniref:SlyX protein n=1 Tax=Oryzomicrobium terrae TaxID=1735038 RepID=A0A5C1E4J2_9RHOO|nr:SlyX family protein [Oryzomicrobium terrae]QEL63822.1 SlyX protein [Oryzomicrobium terrae]